METSYLIAFSTIAAVFAIVFLVFAAVVWIRLNALEETAPPREVQRALQVSEGTASRMDSAVNDLEKFKDSIHATIQRFYGIMRRNEKSLDRLESAPTQSPSEVPDEIDPADLKQPDAEPEAVQSKAELRALARKRGVQI